MMNKKANKKVAKMMNLKRSKIRKIKVKKEKNKRKINRSSMYRKASKFVVVKKKGYMRSIKQRHIKMKRKKETLSPNIDKTTLKR